MNTLVDGNNMIYAFKPLRKLMISKQIDEARRGLFALFSRLIKSGRVRAPVTVIFDGRASGPATTGGGGDAIKVRFAPPPDTADRLIGDTIEFGAGSEEYTVITSDREVQTRCRRLGAKVVGVGRFIEKHVPERREPEPAPELSDDDARALEKPQGELPDFEVTRWLEEFGLED